MKKNHAPVATDRSLGKRFLSRYMFITGPADVATVLAKPAVMPYNDG